MMGRLMDQSVNMKNIPQYFEGIFCHLQKDKKKRDDKKIRERDRLGMHEVGFVISGVNPSAPRSNKTHIQTICD